MEENTIFGIIQQTLAILEKEVGLAKSTLDVVASQSLKPILDFFNEKQSADYNETLIGELEEIYRKKLQDGERFRSMYNRRVRGIRILREVHETGSFVWKGADCKNIPVLPEIFENIITNLADTIRQEKRGRINLNIARRFLQFLADSEVKDISQIKAEYIQMFLVEISQTRKKSMDDVVGALRKLHSKRPSKIEVPGNIFKKSCAIYWF